MIQEVESVCHELKVFSLKAKVENDKKNEQWYNQQVELFRQTTFDKIQMVTANIANNSYIKIQEREKEIKNDANSGTNFTQETKHTKIQHNLEDVKYGILISAEEKSQNQAGYEFEDINVKSYIPKSLPSGCFLFRMLWTSYDYLTPNSSKSKKMIIGGVFDVTLYNSLPQPKMFNDYMIKPFRPEIESLEVLPFPVPGPNKEVVINQNSPKIEMSYQLPQNLYYETGEEPKVIQWIPSKQTWTEIYTEDIEIKEKDRILSLKTKRFVPMALCQDRTVDFPYLSWKLRSTSDKVATLDIQGKRMSLQFEIGQGYVMLKKKDRKDEIRIPQLAHIENVRHQPAQILYELYKCGINLLPEDHDQENGQLLNLKDSAAEDKAIEDICIAIRSYYFKSTRFNAGGPKGKQFLT